MSENKVEKQKKERRDITFIEALVLFLSYIAIFACGIITGYPTAMSILICASVTAVYAIVVLHFEWEAIQKKIVDTFSVSLPSIMLLLVVGFVSASWLASGTIPTLIVYGLKVLNPSIFLVAAFVVTAIISIATGSSWSTVATFGVALVGVASGMGLPMGLVGGAIVSGCWLGDKWSPFSDTTNLAAAVTGNDVMEVFKYNAKTSGLGAVIAGIIFTVLGFRYAGNAMDASSIDALVDGISDLYVINPITLIPIILVVVLSIMRKPVLPVLVIAAVSGAIVSVLVQGKGIAENIYWMYNGYTTSTGVEDIDKLLSGGGMLSMASIVMIIFCALTLGGVLNEVGLMQALLSKMGALTKTRGTLVLTTMITAIVTAYLGGSVYTGLILPVGMFEGEYEKQGLSKLDLSRTVLEGAGHTSAIIPWCASHILIFASLGIAWYEFLPYYYSFWASIALMALFGFTGWFMSDKKKSVA